MVEHIWDNLDKYDPKPEMPLDEGIRRWVCVLLSQGIETFESCEGGPGHSFPEPTIRFYGNPWAGYRAFEVAMTHGLPVSEIRRAYSVVDGELEGPVWEIVFMNKDEQKTD